MDKKIVVIISPHSAPVSIGTGATAEQKEWRKRKAFMKKILALKKKRDAKPYSIKNYYKNLDRKCAELLANIKRDLPELKELLKKVTDH